MNIRVKLPLRAAQYLSDTLQQWMELHQDGTLPKDPELYGDLRRAHKALWVAMEKAKQKDTESD